MSHNEEGLQKQQRRHKGPLIGISLAVVFALTLLFFMLSSGGESPAIDEGATVVNDPTLDEPAATNEGGTVDSATDTPAMESTEPADIPADLPADSAPASPTDADTTLQSD